MHRQAEFVLNLTTDSQESSVCKLEFCHLFLKIKVSPDKLKKISFRSKWGILSQRGKNIRSMGMRLFHFL